MSKKTKGLLILLVTYVVAFVVGLLVYKLCIKSMPELLAIFIGNVVGTIITWFSGVLFNTASTYDPYWSVQTPVIYLCLLIKTSNFNAGTIIYFVFIMIWAIRLTGNFIKTFHDISYIDWRYAMIKEKSGKLYQLVNLIGICMVPTCIVYAGSIPSLLYVLNNNSFNALSIIGVLIMLLGPTLEYLADTTMHRFNDIKENRNLMCREGIWKYSRHPNYLGEMTFWYGLALYYILPNINQWYLISCAIIVTIMFLTISIPMADNNLKKLKPNYKEYRKQTRMLLPFKK